MVEVLGNKILRCKAREENEKKREGKEDSSVADR